MKALKIFIALFLLSFASFAQYKNLTIQAAGLTCSMCSNTINKALQTLPYIESVDTDLKNNLFRITLKEGTTPDFDQIKQKVEGAGFSVAKLNVDLNFSGEQVEKDKHVKVNGKNLHFVNAKNGKLSGWHNVQIVDKGFVVSNEYKRLSKKITTTCYQSGKAADCCDGIKAGERVYHVSI